MAIDPAPFDWETDNSADIHRHWRAAIADKPTMFDGIVYMVGKDRVETAPDAARVYHATCHPMRFSTLTWWRHLGMPPVGFHGTFGNLILRGNDGGLLMARTAAHTASGGMIGFPGGSFDDGDVVDGHLDALGCCQRECAEETGVTPADVDLATGFMIYRDQRRHAISRVGNLRVPADAARARILSFLDTQSEPELDQIHIIRDGRDLDHIDPHPYSRALAEWILQTDFAT